MDIVGALGWSIDILRRRGLLLLLLLKLLLGLLNGLYRALATIVILSSLLIQRCPSIVSLQDNDLLKVTLRLVIGLLRLAQAEVLGRWVEGPLNLILWRESITRRELGVLISMGRVDRGLGNAKVSWLGSPWNLKMIVLLLNGYHFLMNSKQYDIDID